MITAQSVCSAFDYHPIQSSSFNRASLVQSRLRTSGREAAEITTMLAVYVFCSLVVLASTDTVEVKFVPATLPNSCDMDRYEYDNILYQSNILLTIKIFISGREKSKYEGTMHRKLLQICRSSLSISNLFQ